MIQFPSNKESVASKIEIAGHYVDLSRIIYVGPIHNISNLSVYALVFENNVELILSNVLGERTYFPREKLIEMWKALWSRAFFASKN